MRRLLACSIVAVAAGCGSAAGPPTAPVAAELPANEVESAAPSIEGRSVTLLRYGAVAFAADAPPVRRGGATIWEPERRRALAVSGDRVQIESVEYGARLALWVERDDLATVALVETRLALAPGVDAAGDSGVTVFEGTPLSIVERRGAAVRVSNQVEALPDEDLSFEGWLDGAVLGTFYLAHEREPTEPAPEAKHYVLGGRVLLDAPGGRPIGRFHSDDADDLVMVYKVERLGPERDGAVQIAVREPGFVAVGWVTKDRQGSLGLLRTGGSGTGTGHSVPAGTCLHAAEGGAVIGEAIEVVELWKAPTAADGWSRVEIGSRWGALPVWVRAVDDGYATCDGGVAKPAAP